MDLIGKCLLVLVLLTIWCRVIENIDFIGPIVKQSGFWLFEFFRFVLKTCINFAFWSFVIVLLYNIFWFIFCSQLRHIENPLGSEPTIKYNGRGRPIPANVRISPDKPWWDWEIIPRISEENIINFCNRFKQTQKDNQKLLQTMEHVIPAAAVHEDVLNSTTIRPSRSRNYHNYTTLNTTTMSTITSQFKEFENISPIKRPDTSIENDLRTQIQKQMEIQERQRLIQLQKQQFDQQHQQQLQQNTKQNHFTVNSNYNNGSGDHLITTESGIWKRNSVLFSNSKPQNQTISSTTNTTHKPVYYWYNKNLRN